MADELGEELKSIVFMFNHKSLRNVRETVLVIQSRTVFSRCCNLLEAWTEHTRGRLCLFISGARWEGEGVGRGSHRRDVG
jgi:hypothetical protein